MANISEEKWIEMLEKKADGSYIAKYPKIKSKSGVTFDAHLADIASQDVGKGADIIGLPDPNNLFTATNIGGAMQELFTNVSNGKQLVGTAITDVDPNVTVPTDPTFTDLDTAIRNISTGKKFAIGTTSNIASGGTRTIGGLGFIPKHIFVFGRNLGQGGDSRNISCFIGTKGKNSVGNTSWITIGNTTGRINNEPTSTSFVITNTDPTFSLAELRWLAFEEGW